MVLHLAIFSVRPSCVWYTRFTRDNHQAGGSSRGGCCEYGLGADFSVFMRFPQNLIAVSRSALRSGWLECLEPRRLLSAGQLDPAYGDGGILRLADTSAYGYSRYEESPTIA